MLHQLISEIRSNPALVDVLRNELAVPDPDALLTAAEIAPRFRKSAKTVERWCRAGRIPSARKIGRTWVMPADAVVKAAVPKSLGDAGALGPRGGRRPAVSDVAGREVVQALRASARERTAA